MAHRLIPLLFITALFACGDEGGPAIDADTPAIVDAGTDAQIDATPIDGGGVDAHSLGNGEVCVFADGGPIVGECGVGLVCCYPCGIAGCDSVCQIPCDGGPGCESGCPLLP